MAEIHAKKPRLAAAASFVGSTPEYYDWFDVFLPGPLGQYRATADLAAERGTRPPRLVVGPWTHIGVGENRWRGYDRYPVPGARNLNTGRSAYDSAVTAVARQRIFHDPDRPSRITLTVVEP